MYNAPKFERFHLSTLITYKDYTLYVSLVDLGDYDLYHGYRYELMAFAGGNYTDPENMTCGDEIYSDRFADQTEAAREFFHLTDNADLWLKPYEDDIDEACGRKRRR